MSRRLLALTIAVVLVPLTGVFTGTAAPEPATATPGAAGKATHFKATIRRTQHGIPHITAKNWPSLGFGAGYAAAETTICTLADTVITARGERSRWLGADARYRDEVTLDATNLQVDAFVTDLHNRKVVEHLMADPQAGPGRQARHMVRGFAAGVNAWLSKVGGADGVTDPACHGAAYLQPNTTAKDVWYGVYLANLLASSGVFVPQIVDAKPPLPTLPVPPTAAADGVDRDALLAGLGRDPESPFGSNATAVGGDATTTGKGMLLGNPHFPWRGRYRFTQQHLTIPGKYDVAGASLVGSPVVNIGWNKRVAWSHTVSTAYRFTPYEYRSLGGTAYLTDAGPQQLEHRTVSVTVRKPDGSLGQVAEDLYRTPQGYVIDAPDVLMPWTPESFWAIRDANAEQLRTIDTFLAMGRARNVRDLLRRQDAGGGMPWVNTTAADRHGDVLYADHSVVPNVPDSLAEACMTPTGRVLDQVAGLPGLDGTRADSSCAWLTDPDSARPGVFGPSHLPSVVRRDWVTNANDSHWLPNPASPLEGYAGIIGCERCERTMRTRMVDAYVMDRLAGTDHLATHRRESPRTLRRSEHEDRLMAAEVMRTGGALDTVCAVTGQADACSVLKAWDGRSRTTSVGTHIFEEFVARLPEQGVWLTPFSADDPLHTPRDLAVANPQVVQAMSDAIASLRSRGVPMTARWGTLQVAGDRGAPPIPLGGGTGDSVGNANALASREPEQNKDRYRAVTYGSSHIQAVAFLPGGRVSLRTILTYGQSENPRSPWSRDQTRLFSRGRWLSFPWTVRQIEQQLVRKYVVVG